METKSERNKAISDYILLGVDLKTVARLSHVSIERIRQIVANECRSRNSLAYQQIDHGKTVSIKKLRFFRNYFMCDPTGGD